MAGSGAHARSPKIQCDQTESVLAAIEAGWAAHHAGKPGFAQGLYATLALVLNEEGLLIDTVDRLEILEHRRRRGLPITDILHALEERVRRAGYRGERLGLADFSAGGKPVYAFYDGSRFETFVELKQKTQLRIAVSASAERNLES